MKPILGDRGHMRGKNLKMAGVSLFLARTVPLGMGGRKGNALRIDVNVPSEIPVSNQ